MAQSAEFLAKIKLVMEGTAAAKQQIESIKKDISNIPDLKNATSAVIRKAMAGTGEETVKASKGMADFGKAMSRALIVAPVWMAMRAAIQQVTYFVQEGIQYYLETEHSMHNVNAAMQELGSSSSTTMPRLIEQFHILSSETGKSEGAIANVFAEMVRVLGDSNTAWTASEAAQRLSIATGGDAAKIAETLGMLYKSNGETLNQAATETQRFKDLQVMLYEAQSKTPGGIEKLNANLLAGIPIMATANISIEDFIKLNSAMAAAGITSGMALKTGLTKIITNLSEVSNQMGLSFSKNTPTMTVFMSVMEKLGAAMKTGEQGSVGKVIKDVFGGVRGGQIAAMAKDIETLQKNMNTPLVNDRSIALYAEQIKQVTEGVDFQGQLFLNLKKQAGDAFITGIMGGNNFAEALKNANKIMEDSALYAQSLGGVLNATWRTLGAISTAGVTEGIKGEEGRATAAEKTYEYESKILEALKGQMTAQEMIMLTGEIEITKDGRTLEQKKELIELLKLQVGKEQAVTKAKEDQVKVDNDAVMLGKEQSKELESLLMKYASAKPGDRKDLRREIELTQMSSESQITAFNNNSGNDRKLMLSMQSKLEETTRNAMAGTIARENGISVGTRFGQGQPMSIQDQYPGWNMGGSPWAAVGKMGAGSQVPGMTTINSKGADTININLAVEAGKAYEETIKKLNEEIMNKILTNPNFQKAFGIEARKNKAL